MSPSADVQAMSSIRVDISGVEPGTQLTVKWLGKPVFIRRRTPEEIEMARENLYQPVPLKPDLLKKIIQLIAVCAFSFQYN
jgi:Rieske Fe-S protein